MQPAQLVRSLLLPVACLMSDPATAVDAYIDLSVGRSTVQHWNAEDINIDGSVSATQGQDTDRSLRLAIGFGLSKNFTAEFGHIELGKATAEGISDGSGGAWAAGPIGVKTDIGGYDVALLAKLPISDRFALVTRVGAFMWTLKSSAHDTSNVNTAEDGGSEVYFGGGLQFLASPMVSLRGDFTRYSVDFLDIHVVSLSAIWHLP